MTQRRKKQREQASKQHNMTTETAVAPVKLSKTQVKQYLQSRNLIIFYLRLHLLFEENHFIEWSFASRVSIHNEKEFVCTITFRKDGKLLCFETRAENQNDEKEIHTRWVSMDEMMKIKTEESSEEVREWLKEEFREMRKGKTEEEELSEIALKWWCARFSKEINQQQ